ncbi:MAG TPA: deoxyguanosinetriphosphate triphosphohydrolase [Syntrophomonadaceae bacterium]|nr:deoxyguanosinetriphosphate triphosphohydrolase [Syntrophomonadaceae bacterium]
MPKDLSIREQIEKREAQYLAPYAVLCARSRGRLYPEDPCPVRTVFMRDRDRIIYTKAFRRLKHKTQVFISPEGDHYRTRSTHTLEVSQISRTLARALRLNEDLTEAIALGHDLGHTPFGHSGEFALNEVFPAGFRHNEQSLRVVDKLEGERGLNLTWEVRDGILCHTGSQLPATLEGQIVRIADRISYINHDIDDAIRAGIIKESDLPRDCIKILGNRHKARINTMVTNIIEKSWGKPEITMSDDVQVATDGLRSFLFQQVYIGSVAKKEEAKAQRIVKTLYEYYLENPDFLTEDLKPKVSDEGLERCVVDYIAGMTDRFALKTFERHFVPSSWMI